jgi:hypothetical protein
MEARDTSSNTQRQSRITLILLAALVLAGCLAGWNKGRLPQRAPRPVTDATRGTTPDLALYQAIIADVRGGRDYYDAAHEHIPAFGFPISSPLNWRLPTYAWVFSLLPGKCWIQGALLVLGIAGLVLTFASESATSNVLQAGFTTLLMFGVFRWVLDGDAYLAQEVWAGVLIMISVAALRLGEASWKWRLLAVAAGIAALMFRELALPFCLAAGGLALWQRRRWEAALWANGVAVFGLLLVWHVAHVRAELAEDGIVGGGAGLAQWLRFGGIDFVLLTARMNSLLFHWPSMISWLYLVVAMIGLANRADLAGRVSCWAALIYLLAFAIVGRPENFYWGLIYAPLLPAGVAAGVAALARHWRQAAQGNLPPLTAPSH